MTPFTWFQAIIPAILLFICAFLGYKFFRSWLAPGSFFGLYWSSILILALTIAPDYYFWPGASWLILCYGLVLLLGNIISWSVGVNLLQQFNFRTSSLFFFLGNGKLLMSIFFFISLSTIPPILYSLSYDMRLLLSPSALAYASHDFSVNRYLLGYDIPLTIKIANSFLYLGALLGGVWLATARSWSEKIWAYVLLLPALLQAIILTSRNTLLYPIIFMFSSYLATKVINREHSNILTWSRIKWTVVIFCLLSVFYLGLQVLRDDFTTMNLEVSLRKFRSATIGSPAAFSQWLELHWNITDPAYGAYSFAGIFDQLQIQERVEGLYDDNRYLGVYGDQAESTNIHTMFRGLIEDFTVPMSILLMFILGLILGFVYLGLSIGNAICLPLLALFYSYTLWGMIASLLNYNSLILTWIFFHLLFLFPRWSFLKKLKVKPSKELLSPYQP